MTSLRHLDTTRVFAWLVWYLFEDSHLNSGRRKRPVFSQTRYSRVNVQTTDLEAGCRAEGSLLPVEMAGLEPATPCLQSRCSSS